jgi:hypothetical protein
MDEWMQSGKAVGGMVPKKWRKERTLESVSIDPDSEDGVRGQMEAKNKDVLGANLATTGFALGGANETKRSIGRDPPAN